MLQAVKVHDVVIADVRSGPSACDLEDADGSSDRVLMHLVRRGTWRFAATDGSREAVAVPVGSFIARREDLPSPLGADPGTAATVLILPGPVLGPLLGGRRTVGPARSAEARVLMAHAGTVGRTAGDLSPAGARGARDALIELARGVLRQEIGSAGSRAAPALARSAMEIADTRLTDPGLSPSSLARDLNVSVRTLHRSFAEAGEPVAAYIRRGRLERARAELAAPTPRPDISKVAARWCFADNSHFTRAFRKQYGETPSQFARAAATDWPAPGLLEAPQPGEDRAMSNFRYTAEMLERAVKMVMQVRRESGQEKGVVARVAQQLGIGREALLGWLAQAEVDSGARPRTTSDDKQRIKELERENSELRRRMRY